MDLDALVASARAQLRPSEPIGSPADTNGRARFELFHAPNSICSQKARAVLAHHGMPYLSTTLNIRAGETYLPGFVRLRMTACDLAGLPLVSKHTGSTAVETGGCDPAVVPLLVDWNARKLIVDSKRICIYIDQAAAADARLRPDAQATAIDAELDLVDSLPNYQMLLGKTPGAPQREHAMPSHAGTGASFAVGKVERCDRYLAEYPDDKTLQRAYRAKRAKEADAAEQLFTPEAMAAAYERAEAACERLEQSSPPNTTAWVFGERVSMADLFWAIELLRMKNLGAHLLGHTPHVARYVERCEADAAIRSAVLDWPGALF